jgi:hypothetical protein
MHSGTNAIQSVEQMNAALKDSQRSQNGRSVSPSNYLPPLILTPTPKRATVFTEGSRYRELGDKLSIKSAVHKPTIESQP